MKKRICSALLVVVLCVTTCGTAFAGTANEPYDVTPIIAPEMDVFQTAGEAIRSSDNRAMASALLMFEFVVYQLKNDLEMEARAVWNDCIIGRSANIVTVVYDLGDGEVLLMVYDTVLEDMYVNYTTASLAAARKTFEDQNYTYYTVDGNDWTDVFQMIIRTLVDE